MTKDFVEENNLSLTKLALKNDFDKLLELLIDLDKIARYDNDGTPTSHYLLFTPNKILQSNLINHLDLNAVDKNNSSLAHKIPFSTNGYTILNSLITSNADIDFNLKGHRGWTPLHFAAKEKKETIYNVMVAFGANENARARGGATPKKILNRW